MQPSTERKQAGRAAGLQFEPCATVFALAHARGPDSGSRSGGPCRADQRKWQMAKFKWEPGSHDTQRRGPLDAGGHLRVRHRKVMKQVQAVSARGIRRLRRSELPVDTIKLARYLIGKTLVHDLPTGRLSGRIVESEGYPPGDSAGRAFRGETPGNHSLFLGHGRCHVYFTYGSSFMMNVTS